MLIKEHKYFGDSLTSIETESFHISLTSHEALSETPLHYHENPYMCFLIKGIFEEKNRENNSIIEPGDVLYREKGNIHANRFSECLTKCLNIELLTPEKLMLENNIKLPDKEIKRVGSIEIYSILQSLHFSQSEDLINIQCYEALIRHFDSLQVLGNPNWLNTIIEKTHSNPFENISLSQLSCEFNLHPNYIVRKFKEKTGYRLSEYLNRLRLETALKDMLSENKMMTEIAYENGFFDQSHFIHNFRKYFNLTPSNLKKIAKG